jgi:hypothetical protein
LFWPGDVVRLQDKISPGYLRKLGAEKKDVPKKTIRFIQMNSIGLKMTTLLRGTHWGKMLCRLCGKKSPVEKSQPWARAFVNRIESYFKGHFDPYLK